MRYCNVPLIRQEMAMSCWHASARMLWAWRHLQSIHPLPAVYTRNAGLTPAGFVRLATALGLQSVPEINMSYTSGAVDRLLRNYGPLWAAGYWYGAPHIIVITGVDADGTLYVNDPGHPVARVHDMGFFNQKIAADVANPILYMAADFSW